MYFWVFFKGVLGVFLGDFKLIFMVFFKIKKPIVFQSVSRIITFHGWRKNRGFLRF